MSRLSLKSRLLVVVGFVAAAVLPLPTDPPAPLTISVIPRVALAPSDIRVIVVAEYDKDNRGLDVVLADGLPRARSYRAIEGENGPRTFTVWFTRIPAGEYEVKAILYGPGQAIRHMTSQEVSIREAPQESQP